MPIISVLNGKVFSEMADVQRQKVYDWQYAWRDWNHGTISDRAVRSVIRRAERLYRVSETEIKLLTKNYNATGQLLTSNQKYWYVDGWPSLQRHKITIIPAHRNIPIALHEVAHVICTRLFNETVESHGKEWLGIFMWLLAKEKIAPVSALYASAREFGLKWVSAEKINPKMIRKTYKKKLQALATESYRRL